MCKGRYSVVFLSYRPESAQQYRQWAVSWNREISAAPVVVSQETNSLMSKKDECVETAIPPEDTLAANHVAESTKQSPCELADKDSHISYH